MQHVALAALGVALGAGAVLAPAGGDGDTAAEAATSTSSPATVHEQLRAVPRLPAAVAGAAAPPSGLTAPVLEVAPDGLQDIRRREVRAARRASRAADRSVIPGCDPVLTDVGAENGRLDTGNLCRLPWAQDHMLRPDAAVALTRLASAYARAFGEPPNLTDSYRSYGDQIAVRNAKPRLAARPGTSDHGWGLAVDLAGGVQAADVHYDWLREHAPAFGWDNPPWARAGGSQRYEPWHWEYVAGTPKR